MARSAIKSTEAGCFLRDCDHVSFPQMPTIVTVSFFNDEGVMMPVVWSDGPCICPYCPNRHRSRSFQAMHKHLRDKHSESVAKFDRARNQATHGQVSVAYNSGGKRHFLFNENTVPRMYSGFARVANLPTEDSPSSGGLAVAQDSVKGRDEEKENVDKDEDSALSVKKVPEAGKKRPRVSRQTFLPVNRNQDSGVM